MFYHSSQSLNCYELSIINIHCLASSECPYSPKCRDLSHFRAKSEWSLLLNNAGIEPTTFCMKNKCSTKWANYNTHWVVPFQLLHNLLSYKIQHYSYFSPCEILSVTLRLRKYLHTSVTSCNTTCPCTQILRLYSYSLVHSNREVCVLYSDLAGSYTLAAFALTSSVILSDYTTFLFYLVPHGIRNSFRRTRTCLDTAIPPKKYGGGLWETHLSHYC